MHRPMMSAVGCPRRAGLAFPTAPVFLAISLGVGEAVLFGGGP